MRHILTNLTTKKTLSCNKITINNFVMNEYIIVNKSTIQKRIEELELLKTIHSYRGPKSNENEFQRYNNEQIVLKQILSQSTPLHPVVDDGWDCENSPTGRTA